MTNENHAGQGGMHGCTSLESTRLRIGEDLVQHGVEKREREREWRDGMKSEDASMDRKKKKKKSQNGQSKSPTRHTLARAANKHTP